jgi:hypothetical protein
MIDKITTALIAVVFAALMLWFAYSPFLAPQLGSVDRASLKNPRSLPTRGKSSNSRYFDRSRVFSAFSVANLFTAKRILRSVKSVEL